MSNRVVPFPVCGADVEAKGQVVLSPVLPGEEVQQNFKITPIYSHPKYHGYLYKLNYIMIRITPVLSKSIVL